MSRLAELIEELCPDGVEYQALGELGAFFGGLSGKSKSDFVEIHGARPFVTYKEVYSLLEIEQCPQGRVLIRPHEKHLILQRGDVLFTGSSENIDEVGLTAVVTTEFSEPVYLNSFSICLRWRDAIFEAGYAKYLFNSPAVRRQIRRCASGVTRFNLSRKRLQDVRIPVPPLEVQREIVRILDQFTTLEAELEAELEARRAQYEHYRNHLLSYNSLAARGPVEIVKLGDIASISKNRIAAEYLDETNFVGVDNLISDRRGRVDSQYSPTSGSMTAFSEGDILIGNIRPYLRKVWFSDRNGGCSGDVVALTLKPEWKDRIFPRFLYYVVSSVRFFDFYQATARGGSIPRGDKKKLLFFSFTVPCKQEQEHIAMMLDRFEALINDISSGLPAEIAARRTQYEHYRDRLLSFPEKHAD